MIAAASLLNYIEAIGAFLPAVRRGKPIHELLALAVLPKLLLVAGAEVRLLAAGLAGLLAAVLALAGPLLAVGCWYEPSTLEAVKLGLRVGELFNLVVVGLPLLGCEMGCPLDRVDRDDVAALCWCERLRSQGRLDIPADAGVAVDVVARKPGRVVEVDILETDDTFPRFLVVPRERVHRGTFHPGITKYCVVISKPEPRARKSKMELRQHSPSPCSFYAFFRRTGVDRLGSFMHVHLLLIVRLLLAGLRHAGLDLADLRLRLAKFSSRTMERSESLGESVSLAHSVLGNSRQASKIGPLGGRLGLRLVQRSGA